MNPLDKEELKAFLQTIKKDIPIHTDDTVKIKSSFSQNMPKNLMDYSEKIDNEFLNNNLHTIEEMEFRKKGITNDFKNYQNKYYGESGILNHDLYFEHDNKIYSKVSGSGVLINPYRFTVACTNGADITSGSTTSNTTGWSNQISGVKVSATANRCYNRIASNVQSAVGNQRLGCYDDGGGTGNTATNLLSETASHVVVNGFNWQTVSEFTLPDTVEWIVQNSSSGSNSLYYGSGSTRLGYNPFTYGAFENPIVSESYPDTNYNLNLKIGHS